MKKLLFIAVVAALATSASADTWWGTSTHSGYSALVFKYAESTDPNLPPYWIDDVSMRFTAYKSATAQTGLVQLKNGGTNGVQAMFQLCENDPNNDEPGAVLASTAMTAVPALAGAFEIDFSSTASLTKDSVYHFQVISDVDAPADPNFGKSFRINMAKPDQQHVYNGLSDSDMGVLQWNHGWDYPDPLPDVDPHWEAGPGDPTFALEDTSGDPVYKEGVTGANSRWNNNSTIREKIVLQEIPAGELGAGGGSATAVAVDKVKIYYQGAETDPADVVTVWVEDGLGNMLASGTAPIMQSGASWQEVTLSSAVIMDVGSQYHIGATYSNTSGNGKTLRYGNQGSSVPANPKEEGFYGTSCYHIDRSGNHLTDKDMLFGIHVPEPATLSLLVVGAFGVLIRKRR